MRLTQHLGALIVLASCGGSEKASAPPVSVARVDVSVADTILVPGQISAGATIVRDATGASLPGVAVSWTSSDPTIVRVDAGGAITALRVGPDVTIRATAGGISGQVVVSVREGALVYASGGLVVSADGRARVTFGPGALPDRTPVRIEPATTAPNDFRLVAGSAYRVISKSVVLANAADVLLRYDTGAIPGGVADVLALHALEGQTWTLAGTAHVDTAAKTVTASVQRLATFALLGQGPAASIEIDGNPSTEGGVGETLSTPPRVRVTNMLGAPLRRAVVRFTVVEGGGTVGLFPIGSIDVFTDSAGLATVPAWRLGKAGPNAITASVSGLPPLTFRANGIAFLSIVVGGAHTCAIAFEREAWCWGDNAKGELGTGQSSGALLTPQRVAGSQKFAALSAAGGTHTCGGPESGQLHCWGWGGYGSLGDGTFGAYKSAPTPVSGTIAFRTFSAGVLHTCALSDAGEAYCWGWNGSGQLGDGSQLDRNVPVAVSTPLRFASIVSGLNQTCALTSAGAAYCWGDWLSHGWPVPLVYATPAPVGGPTFTSLTVGAQHVCGLEATGDAWCWGADYAGQFGNGTTSGVSAVPIRAAGGRRFVQLVAGGDHTCGLAPDGQAWCWGRNLGGEIGDGSFDRRLSPAQVLGGLVFTQIAAGGATCGLTTDTAAYCWGKGTAVPVMVPFPPP